MPVPEIANEPCDCPPEECAHDCPNPLDCINRVKDGDVRIKYCDSCKGYRWHQNGNCIAGPHLPQVIKPPRIRL